MQREEDQMPVAMGYVVEEADATPREELTMASTPRGSSLYQDAIVEDLVKQAIDSSKGEIAVLRDLTKEQKAKIGSQRTKIAELKAKNLHQEEELVQRRVEAEAHLATIVELKAMREERETVVEQV